MNNYEKIRQLQEYGFHPVPIGIYFDMVDYVRRSKYLRNRVPVMIREQLSNLEAVLLIEHKRLIKQ